MYRLLSVVSLAIAAWTPASVRGDEAKFVVVGYLPEYRIADVAPEQFAPITDLVYFGIEPPADGCLSAAPVAPAVLQRLHQIKRVAKCRMLICVGGWNRSEGFPVLAKSDAARQRFIAGLLEYCQNNRFDGVDYDWEQIVDEIASFVVSIE